MRLLHTSDWHLGRTLHGFPLLADQGVAVAGIVDLAIERSVDVVIVAGDIFDRAVPPVDALRLLNATLNRLDEAGITTIITAGNHDNGDRLATYAGLLRERVRLVGSNADIGVPIEVADEFSEADGPVLVYPLPYLEPDFARIDLGAPGEPVERSHEAVMAAALDRVATDITARGGLRAVVVGHAFVANAVSADEALTSDSERDLTVGGVQIVPASVFGGRGLQYVALGHLHRPQQVGESGPAIHYSGSLLRYSLSEADQVKSVLIVDIGGQGAEVEVERVTLPESRGMSRLRGTMEELTGDAFIEQRDHFVELVVTDADYPDRMHARLDDVFPYALAKVHERPDAAQATQSDRGDARGRDPLDVMAQFFRKVTGGDPSEARMTILRATYEAVRAGRS